MRAVINGASTVLVAQNNEGGVRAPSVPTPLKV